MVTEGKRMQVSLCVAGMLLNGQKKERTAVLAARGAKGAVGGNGDGVDVAGVADVVGAELALGELPNLKHMDRC